jgi:hypothetical protein
MKNFLLILGALVAGFAGGILGTGTVHSHRQENPEEVVRARRFELVDRGGRVISYWGFDKNDDVALVFGSNWAAGRPNGGPRPGGLEVPDNQRAALGVVADSAYLIFRGADGKQRVDLALNAFEKPTLVMGDETGGRVLLGVRQSDTPGPQDDEWFLQFLPERAGIGTYSRPEAGQWYVKGLMWANPKEDVVKYPGR